MKNLPNKRFLYNTPVTFKSQPQEDHQCLQLDETQPRKASWSMKNVTLSEVMGGEE